jgi:hypothetical protein
MANKNFGLAKALQWGDWLWTELKFLQIDAKAPTVTIDSPFQNQRSKFWIFGSMPFLFMSDSGDIHRRKSYLDVK